MFKVLAETGIEHPTVKCSPNGSACVVFNDRALQCYGLSDRVKLWWSRSLTALVDCAFVGEIKLLLSTRVDPPIVVNASDGVIAGRIESPVRTTLRTRYGELYSHTNGRTFLRTTFPSELVELDPETFSAEKSLSAESVSNVVFHPERLMFAGVVDATAQEVIFGTFESTPLFSRYCLDPLPFVHGLGLSRNGRWLHVLGSETEKTKIVTVDLAKGKLVATRSLDLSLEQSVSLPGNEDGVFITPKLLPAIGEARVFLFQYGGDAIITDALGGNEERLKSPHRVAVCSTAQSDTGGLILSTDWEGKLAMWECDTAIANEMQPTWAFVSEGQGVAGPHEAKPIRLVR